MNLTNDRMERLASFLSSNLDRAKSLLELSPEEAVTTINAEGFDFTVEEIEEFGKFLQTAATNSENGELSEEELGDVAGGIGVVAGALIALGAGILVGGMDHFKIW